MPLRSFDKSNRWTSSPEKYLYLRQLLLACIFFPFIIVPLLVYRWILKKWIFYREQLHMLRHHGCLALRQTVEFEPHTNCVIGAKMSGPADLDKLKSLINERLVYATTTAPRSPEKLAYPELQQYCVLRGGYFFWKPEANFCLEDHVRVVNLLPSSYSCADDTQLQASQLQVKYLQEPLAAQRSPWEILVVQPAVPTWHFIFLKYHHSLADGFSATMLLSRCSDQPPILPKISIPERPHGRRLVMKIVSAFWKMATVRTQALPWTQIPMESYTFGPRRHFFHVSTSQQVSMAAVKRVAALHSVSVTAVTFAALTGALRSFLMPRYDENSIPPHLSFPQPVPVPRHPDGLCNSISMVTLRLPLGEISASARLAACEQMLCESKESAEALVSYFLVGLTSLLPSWNPIQIKPGSVPCVSTTNMPGPVQQISFYGVPVESTNILATTSPHPCFTWFLSYNGWLQWSCSGDTRIFTQEEVAEFGGLIGEEFARMERVKPEPKTTNRESEVEV